MTKAPTYGGLYEFFNIKKTGVNWLKRNRILTTFKISVDAAIDLTKEQGAQFMMDFWAQDTLKTSKEAIKFIKKRVFKVNTNFGLYIGVNTEYFKYVITMYERMKKRGKRVNWTNVNTKYIETDILGKTIKYVNAQMKTNLRDALTGAGLGWMLGKGRMPKRMKVLAKRVSKYQGKVKPIRWLA